MRHSRQYSNDIAEKLMEQSSRLKDSMMTSYMLPQISQYERDNASEGGLTGRLSIMTDSTNKKYSSAMKAMNQTVRSPTTMTTP